MDPNGDLGTWLVSTVIPPNDEQSKSKEGRREIFERRCAPAFGCSLEKGKTESSKITVPNPGKKPLGPVA
jgi:hypothetical protein